MQSSSAPSASPKCSDPWSNSVGLGSSHNHGAGAPLRASAPEHGRGDDDEDDVTTELRENEEGAEPQFGDNGDDAEGGIMDASDSEGVKEQSDKEDLLPTDRIMDDGKEGEYDGEDEDGARSHGANQLMIVPVEAQASECAHEEKLPIGEDPLLQALSDTISGLLMDDAMVTQCGHSFGMNGLQRVKDEKQCLSCGAPVPSESLIPNYALRAAVLAYKQNPFRRNSYRGGSQVKTPNRAITEFTTDSIRRKSSQFPYVAQDRVLIKGNKRTPERFVGREAIITTQCLNGWYLVRTLDTGESVRLQYRSLQKIVGSETSNGNLQSQDGVKFNQNQMTKDCQLQCVNRSNQGKHKECHLHGSDVQTSSNSSQEELQSEQVKKVLDLHKFQVEDQKVKDMTATDESAEEDLRATKRTATIGSSGDVEGSTLQTVVSRKEAEGECSTVDLKSVKMVEANAGDNSTSRSSQGAARNKRKRARADPYKRVYVSGNRRRPVKGGNVSASLNVNMDHHISSPVSEKRQDGEMTNPGEEDCLRDEALPFETLKKAICDLESEIPWDCMKSHWKIDHADWLEKVKKSSSIQDISKMLDEFRQALLLDKAGSMSDEAWAEKLEAASVSGGEDGINSLWVRLKGDVSKWIESRFRRNMEPPFNVKDALVDSIKLEKLIPQLHAVGLSHTGSIAAACVGASEAFADGKVDMESLLGVLMRLINDHGNQDLLAVWDVVEAEKRHICAKVALLESANYRNGTSNEDIDNDLLIENPKQGSESPAFLTENKPTLTATFGNDEKVC